MSRWLAITLLAVLSCVLFDSCLSATAGRQPVQPIGVIGTQDGKGKSKGVVHPVFAHAGSKPGIEVWRIEKFEPVVVGQNDFGKFHTGDSYVVLFTKELGGKFSWDIFFWLGTETSQDESGAAAIYTVQLDDKLGGLAIQHREVQGDESPAFKSHFKNNLKYLPGGVDSGLRHVDTTVQKKMYIVKGKKNIRVKQVEPSAASLNKGDSFIFDAGSDIYVYQGPKSTRLEKLKAASAATVVRDIDRNGRAKIITIDDFNSPDDLAHFLDVLGAKNLKQIPDDTVGGDDLEFEKHEEASVSLHKVSDATGSLKTEKLNQKPLKQEMLNTNECFILDADKSNIYVWVGKKCNAKEKAEALKKAEETKKSKHYPAWTKVERVIENAEPSIFRQYFQSWRGVGESHSRLIRDTSNIFPCFPSEPKLYHLKAYGNKVYAHHIPDLKQENLRTDSIMILDVGCKTYAWFGKDSYRDEVNWMNLPRVLGKPKLPSHINFLSLKQNDEPHEFIKMFPSWTPDFWNNQYDGERLNEIPRD